MIADDVGERSGAERSGVTFVNGPRAELQGVNRFDYKRIAAKGETRPFVDDCVAQ